MLTPEMAQKKLWELKPRIALDAGKVMEIVRLLQSGKSQYQIYQRIYNEQSKRWEPPIASNNTIFKIKKLLDAGELDWMTDELARLNLLLDRMVEASDEDHQRAISQIKGWEIHKDDGLGGFRLQIIEEAEAPLTDWGWSVSNLTRIGIPLEAVLPILQEFDGLLMARNSSTVAVGVAGTTEYTYLIKFRGFERYLTLLHLVHLMQKYPNSHYEYAVPATAFYTRGVLASDDSIKAQGEDILRYEIGRGAEYLEAYYESLKRYKRTPKRNAELRSQIDALLKGNDDG